MPIYQYRNRSGLIVEALRTIEQRDQGPAGFKRISVPVKLSLFGTSSDPRDEHSADAAVPRAYRQLEEQTGRTDWLKESGFTRDQVRQTWQF